MQIGFFPIGMGLTAEPEIIALIARTVEQTGFHCLWAPEHVVLLDQYSSKLPYSQDGRLPLPTTFDFLDPFTALAFAAAHTKTIRLSTGICLVPEHNPVVLAKEVASVDKLSNGRFDFGIGIGWLAEEARAVGVPWERRGERAREYLKAMKLLWTEENPEFSGEFCRFPPVRLYPKPVQKPYPPIIVGGESGPALKRAGEIGDGWYGMNVTPEEVKTKIARIRQYAQAAGRDPEKFHFTVSPGLTTPVTLDLIKQYRDAGAQQIALHWFPDDRQAITGKIEHFAETFVVPAAKL